MHTKGVKSGIHKIKPVNKPIGHNNKTTRSGINSMNGKQLKIFNVTITCNKEASSAYDNNGKLNNSIKSKNK